MAIDRSKIQKQADGFVAAGKIDRAIEEFVKLLEDKPNDLLMMNRIGDLYLQSGKIRDALDMFKRAAMGYERDGFLPKAAAVLKKAHRAAPDDSDVATRLADSYRLTNMTKEAIQIHIEMADQFTKKGLLKRALEEFAKVVELDPKNLKNKVKLADLYNKEGMKERAAGIYLEVAEALAIEQMHNEANQILERAKTMVSSPQVFLTQSRLCVIQKDLAGASKHLREGLKVNQRSAEILEALAEVELQAKNPEKALEALGDVPQLPEKAMTLCERALKEAIKLGRTDDGLKLFKPIGKDFARRGLGDAAARALQNALQGNMPLDAWMQLADIAHQSGNKQERIDALRHAHAEAKTKGNAAVEQEALTQLKGLGITDDQISAPPQAFVFKTIPAASTQTRSTHVPGETTEVDPVRRMQIQQLTRDAENYVRGRNMDKAQEAYNKVLELDPANRDAIVRIAEIIQASGRMSAVQVHYVKTAERLAGMGSRSMAVEMLDKAEALFPGSTRLYRRTLGLLDVQAPVVEPAAAPAPESPFSLPVIALDTGMPSPQALPVPSEAPSDLDVLIGLDDRGPGAVSHTRVPLTPMAPPPAPPAHAPIALGGPSMTQPEESMALTPTDLNWGDMEDAGPVLPPEPDLEPLELEPLPFATTKPLPLPPAPVPVPVIARPVIPMAAGPVAPPPPPPAPVVVDEELASLLSDIDFQLDYGSPDEAKIELENALKTWPGHPELLNRLDTANLALSKLGHSPASLREEDLEDSHTFFDLTDVLGDALMDSGEGEEMHDATNVVEKVQSVDELFNAFREGVEEQVKGDDYDTHYNLGIAYKEMMLLEPAMEEFKKAMRDPERTLECCSMLSICELAQGNLEGAVKWVQQGINAPGFPPEDSIGLRYDLGDIFIQQGKKTDALEQFRFVYGLDPDYRDVAQKIR